MQDYNVVLPAAGLACRLGSNKPKLLTRFDDQEFLWEKQVEILNRTLNNPHITYVLGFQSNKLIKKLSKYADIVINEKYENTGVGYSIGLGLDVSKKYESTLIVYGDLYFNDGIFNQILESGTRSFIVTDRQNFNKNETGFWDIENNVQKFDYDLPHKWAQITYLTNKDRNEFIIKSRNKPKALGFEILNNMLSCGIQLDMVETEKESTVFDIDSFKDINKVNSMLYEEAE